MDLSRFWQRALAWDVRGILVYQNGEKSAEKFAAGDVPFNIYSGTKSFTSAAAGFAVAERLFTMDDRVIDHFPDDLPEVVCENLAAMRLCHLITMTMGFEKPLLMGDQRPSLQGLNWVKLALSQPVPDVPGEKYLYNNIGPYLLGVLIERKSGQKLNAYLQDRLFAPLGITLHKYETCPNGHVFGAGGFFMTLADYAKLAQLYLDKGAWQGKQILPAAWVAESTRAYARTTVREDAQTGNTYGYLFWLMPRGGFRADGKFEQYAIALPEKNAVVAICCGEHVQAGVPVLRIADEEIFSQL